MCGAGGGDSFKISHKIRATSSLDVLMFQITVFPLKTFYLFFQFFTIEKGTFFQPVVKFYINFQPSKFDKTEREYNIVLILVLQIIG